MQGLGRVNLLVGANNCGKTSILECIELLRSPGTPRVLSDITRRRGEWGYSSDEDPTVPLGARTDSLDISHLFANRELSGRIRIEAERRAEIATAGWNNRVTVSVDGPLVRDRDEWGAEVPEGAEDERLVLHIEWSDPDDHYNVFLTDEGLLYRPRLPTRGRNGSSQTVQFVRTSGMTAADVVRTFSKFVLTPKEEAITQALRIVEPAIERIAPVADDRGRFSSNAPGGVVLKLREVVDRVPIGSVGDGMWRMLGLALSLANAEGGVLLVDEIDTGFHFSVMEDMWRMINEQAGTLSVQVFATTHSRDCYESLAAIAKSEPGDVTIQRIDRSRKEAVRFSREAVLAAAERGIEVR
jgi:ABC-type branched-subunit amino acid transport system ATPase component